MQGRVKLKTRLMTHRKWRVDGPDVRRQAVEEIDVETLSPVGILLGVYGATKLVLHFEDETEESWEPIP